MGNIPNRLECSYCIRHYKHGGECEGKKSIYDETGCLIFKLDSRGCIRNKDVKLQIPLYREIPIINCWNSEWEINGSNTEIRIKEIYGLSWEKEKGYLNIHCNCDYFINEYDNNYRLEKKTVLKIIK